MAFWNRHLNSAGFRLAVDTLLSVAWLRFVYASPFLEVLPPRFGRVLRSRLERCWQMHPNRSNPYARALLLGDRSETPPARGVKRSVSSALTPPPSSSRARHTASMGSRSRTSWMAPPPAIASDCLPRFAAPGRPRAWLSCAAWPNRDSRPPRIRRHVTARFCGAWSMCDRCPELTDPWLSSQLSSRCRLASRARRIVLGDIVSRSVAISERIGEHVEHPAVTILIVGNAAKLAHLLRRDLRYLRRELGEPLPAQPGGRLRMHVIATELLEGAVVEMPTHRTRNLAREPSHPQHQGGRRPRQRCFRPAPVLAHGYRPSSRGARGLMQPGARRDERPVALQQRPAHVDRVPLFILPHPHERLLHHLAYVGGNA